MGDNPSSIDEHTSLTPSLIAADGNSVAGADSWRQGMRLEAIANLAHELRTPVQVLLGYVDILRDDHAPEFSTETHALLDRMTDRSRPGSDLTAREAEVLRLLADGLSNQAIAANLGIRLATVRNHVQSVIEKLHAHSKLEAVAIAAREGLLDRLS